MLRTTVPVTDRQSGRTLEIRVDLAWTGTEEAVAADALAVAEEPGKFAAGAGSRAAQDVAPDQGGGRRLRGREELHATAGGRTPRSSWCSRASPRAERRGEGAPARE